MKKLHYILAVVALTSAGPLLAQPTDGPGKRGPHRGGPHGGHPIVRTLDADKDGEISATELSNAKTTLAALDKNADGTVSPDEMRPARPAHAPMRPTGSTVPTDGRTRPSGGKTSPNPDARPVDPVMLALDANTDGALSSTEINNAVASLKVLDANSDGKLTRDELRPLPPVKS